MEREEDEWSEIVRERWKEREREGKRGGKRGGREGEERGKRGGKRDRGGGNRERRAQCVAKVLS